MCSWWNRWNRSKMLTLSFDFCLTKVEKISCFFSFTIVWFQVLPVLGIYWCTIVFIVTMRCWIFIVDCISTFWYRHSLLLCGGSRKVFLIEEQWNYRLFSWSEIMVARLYSVRKFSLGHISERNYISARRRVDNVRGRRKRKENRESLRMWRKISRNFCRHPYLSSC